MLEEHFDILLHVDGRWQHHTTLYAANAQEARQAWALNEQHQREAFRVRQVKGYAHKQLAEVRGAIKGWAFAPAEWLPRRIEQAEALRDHLPPSLRARGDALIAPLREALSKQGGR